jgi:hypothetical protein
MTDPIPKFKPLKRQSRDQQFSTNLWGAFVIPFVLLSVGVYAGLIAFAAAHFYPDDMKPHAPDDIEGKWRFENIKIVAVEIFIFTVWLACLIGGIPGYILGYIAVRLKDYVVLYQSYDDNSVVDKFGRLATVIGMAPVHALREAFTILRGMLRLRRDRVGITEDIEV